MSLPQPCVQEVLGTRVMTFIFFLAGVSKQYRGTYLGV